MDVRGLMGPRPTGRVLVGLLITGHDGGATILVPEEQSEVPALKRLLVAEGGELVASVREAEVIMVTLGGSQRAWVYDTAEHR